MRTKKLKLISLIIIIIPIFIFGMRYELDYRILTRKTITYFANYELEFYGGKDFRLFGTDFAYILTLLPIGFYFISRKVSSLNKIIGLNLVYMILIPIFYCLYCFLESQFIKMSITNPIMKDGIFQYDLNNVNYRMIIFSTIITTFISGIIIRKITNKKKPIANTVYN
jgi:hypothetical protein